MAFFGQQAALERLLLNPAVPAPRKRAAMEQITRLSRQTPNVSKLLVLLAERDRLVLLKEIAAAYHDFLADRQNVVRAEVTSAEPLSPQRTAAIERRLAAVTGKTRRDDDEGEQGSDRRRRRARGQHGVRRQYRHAAEEDSGPPDT